MYAQWPASERQQMWKEKLGTLWDDHDLIFATDGYVLRKDGITPEGPQDAGQVSARWRSTRGLGSSHRERPSASASGGSDESLNALVMVGHGDAPCPG